MVLDNLRCPSNMGCQCTKHIVYVYDSSWGTVTNEMFSSLVWSHSTKTIQFICTYHRRTHTHILHPDTFFDKSVFHWYVAKTYVVRTRHRAVGLCAAVLWSCKLKRWFMADTTTTILAFYSTDRLREAPATTPNREGVLRSWTENGLCDEYFVPRKNGERLWSGEQTADCDKSPVLLLSVWASMLQESRSSSQLHTDALLKSSQLRGYTASD